MRKSKRMYRCGFFNPANGKEYELHIPDPRGNETEPDLFFGFTMEDEEPVLTVWKENDKTAKNPIAGKFTEEEFKKAGGKLTIRKRAETKLMSQEGEFEEYFGSWNDMLKGFDTDRTCVFDRRSLRYSEEGGAVHPTTEREFTIDLS